MPAWVSEGSVRKYHRAVAQLQKEKKDVTEAAIKTLYVLWGGLVIGGDEEVAIDTVELEDMKIVDLRKLAQEKGIETEGLKKDEIIALLKQ